MPHIALPEDMPGITAGFAFVRIPPDPFVNLPIFSCILPGTTASTHGIAS
jgi:hypothetical protein